MKTERLEIEPVGPKPKHRAPIRYRRQHDCNEGKHRCMVTQLKGDSTRRTLQGESVSRLDAPTLEHPKQLTVRNAFHRDLDEAPHSLERPDLPGEAQAQKEQLLIERRGEAW